MLCPEALSPPMNILYENLTGSLLQDRIGGHGTALLPPFYKGSNTIPHFKKPLFLKPPDRIEETDSRARTYTGQRLRLRLELRLLTT